jgi:hypothetical protein
MSKVRMFRETDLQTECDACNARFDLVSGGVCEQCKRILCARHLHGSWLRRMRHELGGKAICVKCRKAGRG